MAGEKTGKAMTCIEANLKTMKEGFRFLQQLEADPSQRQLCSGIIDVINGVLEKISRAAKALAVTDVPTLQRIDFEVQESGFLEFCEAFKVAVTANYPKDQTMTGKVRLIWNKWKDRIEDSLESVETTVDTWSEIAEGSAAQGILKILSKAITALAKAISSTKID
jgi:hypothetical protein